MLLAFIPVFTLFLGLVQLGLLYVADLTVHHAAYRAARAAAVVLDDDPRYYDGEARGELGGPPVSPGDVLQRLSRMGASPSEVPSGIRLVRPLSRRASVELAAAMVVLPLVDRGDETVTGALATSPIEQRIELAVARTRVMITRQEPGTIPIDRGGIERITVRVEHDFRCSVPIAGALVCPSRTRPIVAEETVAGHRASIEYVEGDWGSP